MGVLIGGIKGMKRFPPNSENSFYILLHNSLSEREIPISRVEVPELDGFGGSKGEGWKNEEVPREEEMSQSGGDFKIQKLKKNYFLESKNKSQS